MGNNFEGGLSPEQIQLNSEAEQLAQLKKDHPELFAIPETERDCEPEIAQFEEVIVAFESEHSLAELNLIIDLTPEEAPNHPVRQPAKLALGPINTKLNALKKETNVSPERYEELRAQYKRLSRAVGLINSNKVDHTR